MAITPDTSFVRRYASWLWPLLGHLLLFLGLYQLGYNPSEYEALESAAKAQKKSTGQVIKESDGPLGFVRYFVMTNSDERLYLEYAKLTFTGTFDRAYVERKRFEHLPATLPERAWPYRDVVIEYPPLSFLIILPPALISLEYEGYKAAFAAWTLLLYLLALFVAFRLAAPSEEVARRRAGRNLLWGSFFLCLAMGPMLIARLDVAVALFIIAALGAFCRLLAATQKGALRRWTLLSGLLVGAGFCVKITPLLVAGLLALAVMARRPRPLGRLFGAGFTALVTILLVHGAVYLFAGDTLFGGYAFHAQRPLQIESLYAAPLEALSALGLLSGQVETGFGSANWRGEGADAALLLAPWLVLLALSAWFWRVYRLLQERAGAAPEGLLLAGALGTYLLFILFNKVLSPQYLIWLFPLVLGLAFGRPRRVGLFLWLLVALAFSQAIYPRAYFLLQKQHPALIALLLLRNGCLIGLFLALWRRLDRFRE